MESDKQIVIKLMVAADLWIQFIFSSVYSPRNRYEFWHSQNVNIIVWAMIYVVAIINEVGFEINEVVGYL